MGLKEEMKTISGRKRRFLLLRIIDVSVDESRKLCGIKKGTYNTWLHNDDFKAVYQRRAELATEYKQEALQLMRRDNQLQAVLLEEKIIAEMRKEIEGDGDYKLLKTHLAREVYSKLINDLDYQPANVSLTWEQRIGQLGRGDEVPAITQGEVIDGEVISETVSIEKTEHTEGDPPSGAEQTGTPNSEEIKGG